MTRVSKGMGIGDLERDAIYRSPAGRLCRWQPGERSDEVAHFVYCSANGVKDNSHNPDGFTLTPGNLKHLRRVG